MLVEADFNINPIVIYQSKYTKNASKKITTRQSLTKLLFKKSKMNSSLQQTNHLLKAFRSSFTTENSQIKRLS